MSDINVQDEPNIAVEDEGYEVVATEEADDQADLKSAELEAQNAELHKQLEALKASQNEPAPAGDQFGELANAIRELQGPKKDGVSEPQTDYNKIIENVRKDFYTDPTKSVLSLLQPVAQEIQSNADKQIQAQSKQISKLTALNTPGDKDLMVKYSSEVEELVGSLPPSERVYQEALQRVKLNHLDDLVNERAQALTQQTIDAAEANVAQSMPNRGPQDLSTMPRKGKVKVQITRQKITELQKWGMIKGYDWNDPADQSFIIEYAKDKGWIA